MNRVNHLLYVCIYNQCKYEIDSKCNLIKKIIFYVEILLISYLIQKERDYFELEISNGVSFLIDLINV